MEPNKQRPVIVSAEWEVDQALRELGLTREIVREVASAAAAARAEALAVDPCSSAGTLSYIYGVRTIRLKLLPLGWKEAREGNVEATVNHERAVQLVFQNVHRACGEDDPEAISGKGAGSRKLINSGQFELFEKPADTATGRYPLVWMICVSADDNSVRAEVSCPAAFEGNQFNGFTRRLFVVDESFEPVPNKRENSDDDSDLHFDIPVTKK